MIDSIEYKPDRHNHDEFLSKAKMRAGFSEAYDALEPEYTLAREKLKARAKAGLTQDAVAVVSSELGVEPAAQKTDRQRH